VDTFGNLYVTDVSSNDVRKVSLAGYTISPTLPAGLAFDSPTGTISGTPTVASPATNYIITAYNSSGSDTASVNITVVPKPAALLINPNSLLVQGEPVVRQAVSPNGDGINDVLTIDNIQSYPQNTVTLVNSNGIEIYRMSGYDNVNKAFDGHSNLTGALQKPGTYFYQLQYNVNGEIKRKTGYFVLKY
jgi:gliding motility-associated-like protein